MLTYLFLHRDQTKLRHDLFWLHTLKHCTETEAKLLIDIVVTLSHGSTTVPRCYTATCSYEAVDMNHRRATAVLRSVFLGNY